MPHISKRRKGLAAKVDRNKTYAAMDALKIIKDAIEDPMRLLIDL